MLVFERLFAASQRAIHLWVETPTRAWAFIVCFTSAILGTAVVEHAPLIGWLSPPPETTDENVPGYVRVLRATMNTAGTGDIVALAVGGSTIREFLPSDQETSRRLSNRCGQPVSVINGGTSSQDLSMAWQIADSVPETSLKLLIIGMNYYRLTHNAKAPINMAFPLRQPNALRQAITAAGGRGYELTFNIRSIETLISEARRSGGFGLFGETAPARGRPDPFFGHHNRYTEPRLSDQDKRATIARFVSQRLAYVEWHENEAAILLTRFVKHFAQRGVAVVALALPEDPSLRAVAPMFEAPFQRTLAKMQAAGALVVDWRGDHDLSAQDFYDQQHLLARGRLKILPRLIELMRSELAFHCKDHDQ